MRILILFAMVLTPLIASASDSMIYNIKTQQGCFEITNKPPTRDCRWHAGLSRYVDDKILGGTIIAYKIKWFNGRWSGWYVPGINDMDWKFNRFSNTRCSFPVHHNTVRLVWSYFYDHVHSYIICN